MKQLNYLIVLLIFSCNSKREFPQKQEVKNLQNTKFTFTFDKSIKPNRNEVYSPTLAQVWEVFKKENNVELINIITIKIV
ncbi:hypothetical protein [Aureivirga sp. CE67]|uniref:hypothetical protein n=1 Tax=Aureivirga sp. CE67 TaxID=1788983 RepID=UPI0018CB00AB|nr:hypothetical protein [Aureivirga sp. CE67]